MLRMALAAVAATAFFGETTGSFAQSAPGWTGFYIGGDIGRKVSNTTWSTKEFNYPGGGLDVDTSQLQGYDAAGLRAGGYFGINYQFSPQWLIGGEFDFGHSNMAAQSIYIPGFAVWASFGSGRQSLTQVETNWDMSARLRIGYVISSDYLVYATGGAAWQEMQVIAKCQHAFLSYCSPVPGGPIVTVTDAYIATGWTAGVGFDARVWGNWTARTEYRYSEFPRHTRQLDVTYPGFPVTTVSYDIQTSTHIRKFGLAYLFQ